MRAPMRPLIAPCLVVALLLTACSSDDRDDGPTDVTFPGTSEALADYWEAGDEAGAALTAADDLWETFAALAAEPSTPPADALDAGRAYAAACTLAASELEAWAELESAITSHNNVKSEIDGDAREAVLTTLECAAAAALRSGEALIVSWRALGGLASLRTALADPEGTLPVTGLLADALEARLAARDAAVVAAIGEGDARDGLLPLDDIPGDTPAEQVTAYNDLDADDPVKLACRAAVPRWDATERDVSLALLERAARGRLRWFADAHAGGPALADLDGHLVGADEASPTSHEITLDLRDGATDEPLAGDALVVLRRLHQPTEEPRLALLADAASQLITSLPAGAYTVVALADGWARAVLPAVATSDGQVLSLELTHLAQGALLFDGIEAPAMAGAGGRVELAAAAASALGDPLTFDWDVRGPEVADLFEAQARCAFVPVSAGTYTALLTVRDASGNARRDSTTIEVKPFAVNVFRTEFLNEQLVDLHLNPGEQDTLQLWVANRGQNDVVGVATATGRDGLIVDRTSGEWTLGAGRQTRWKVPVTVPVDWDRDTAVIDFGFTVDGETLVQELEYRVDFYVELDFIRSPVTSRILTVSGVVANPALETAEMVIDRDRDAVYSLPLTDGAFEQVVILPGSAETRRVRVEVAAEAGSRREEASAGFMAAIAPADFRATLFWDTNETDVDLWVTDPDGEKCYFANKNTASGLELDVDDVTGYGPENITGEADLPSGEYLVQVHYFSDHGTDLPSHCTVMVTLHEGTDQESVVVYEQTITDNEVWTVCAVDWYAKAAAPVHEVGTVAAAPAEIPPAK